MIAAKINGSGVVVQVIEAESVNWCIDVLGGSWIETWIDGGSRKNYAGIGYTFDAVANAFIPQSPYPSWILDPQSFNWKAPKPYPSTGNWIWDESAVEWVEA